MTYSVKAGECLKWDDVVKKSGSGSRLVWRPPRDFRTKAGGDVHSDDRGLFAKYIGHKVVFKNKINAALRVKATVPVGKIDDPTKIFARPIVVDETADPIGTKKDLSRKKGKKGTKNYSKKTDRIEVNVSEKQLFTGDANLYSLFVEKLPGDSLISPTYNADGYVLLDYMPILPNMSQFTGADFAPNMVVFEIIIVVRYIVSRMSQADGARDVIKINNFCKGNLGSLDAVFHVDVDEWLTKQSASGSVVPGKVMTMQVQDDGYPYLGITRRNNKLMLSNYTVAGETGEAARVLQQDVDSNLRMTVPGLGVYLKNEGVFSSEFVYDSEEEAWVCVQGKDVYDVGPDERFYDGVGKMLISSASPVMLFTTVRQGHEDLPMAKDGLVRNYGNNQTYAVKWEQFAQGLAIVIKVLQFALRYGSYAFA